jgi:phytanoyl-CoA hydroxylase
MASDAYWQVVQRNFRPGLWGGVQPIGLSEIEVSAPHDCAAVVATYRRTGCCILRGLLRDSVDSVRVELEGMAASVRAAGWQEINHAMVVADERAGVRKQIMLFGAVHEVMPSVRKVIADPRLQEILRALLGPEPQLFASMCPYKEANGGMAKPLHQDAAYYYHADHSLLNCFVHLVPTDPANGCLRIVPGSFVLGLQEHGDSPAGLALAADRFPIAAATPITAEPGDVVLFNYFTVHGSLANPSSVDRPALAIQFRAKNDVQVWKWTANTAHLGEPYARPGRSANG